jgi:hypothetical protein
MVAAIGAVSPKINTAAASSNALANGAGFNPFAVSRPPASSPPRFPGAIDTKM